MAIPHHHAQVKVHHQTLATGSDQTVKYGDALNQLTVHFPEWITAAQDPQQLGISVTTTSGAAFTGNILIALDSTGGHTNTGNVQFYDQNDRIVNFPNPGGLPFGTASAPVTQANPFNPQWKVQVTSSGQNDVWLRVTLSDVKYTISTTVDSSNPYPPSNTPPQPVFEVTGNSH